ncbi:hypothetical protein BAE44_0021639 [Dichanthelium oligosanthes]|uniref:Uncharacterized protein n=1 Tax=Dichanthelium oligosanthes TaxID=888268 RepID=A0A1E5UWM4_9POAL|nr:hypothetical protein BAE44_0021639 [Dichanthelium oligosanthes]
MSGTPSTTASGGAEQRAPHPHPSRLAARFQLTWSEDASTASGPTTWRRPARSRLAASGAIGRATKPAPASALGRRIPRAPRRGSRDSTRWRSPTCGASSRWWSPLWGPPPVSCHAPTLRWECGRRRPLRARLQCMLALLPTPAATTARDVGSSPAPPQFSVVVRILEIHDFNLPSDSDDSHGSSGSSGADGLPQAGTIHLAPWPKIYNLAGGPSSSGEPWPSLPRTGGGVSWSSPAKTALCAGCLAALPTASASPAPAAVTRSVGRTDGPSPFAALASLVDAACCCTTEQPTVCTVSELDPMMVEAQLPMAPPSFVLEDTQVADSPPSSPAVVVPASPRCLTPTPVPLTPQLPAASPHEAGGPSSTAAIPDSPAAFAQAVLKPLANPVLPLPLRRPRKKILPSAPPRRSNRLAKKALHRTPTLVAAQNVLIRKLGLARDSQIETGDYDRYVQLYKDGLSEEQTNSIRELFSGAALAPPQEADVEGTV